MTQTADANPLQPVGFGRLPGLDGLRAVSISMVLFAHGWNSMPLSAHFPHTGTSIFSIGELGVSTFFVISGYLITYLLRQEFQRHARINLRMFYARRMLRIFPALYSYIVVVCLLKFTGCIQTAGPDIVRASTFLCNYGYLFSKPLPGYWFVGHFWSLSLEEQFYLFWPVTLVILGLFYSRYAALAIVICSPLIRIVYYYAFPTSRPHLSEMLHSGSDTILMGCLGALLEGHPLVERLLRNKRAGAIAVTASLFVGVGSVWLAMLFRGSYMMTVGLSINAFFILYVILYVSRHPQSLGVRFLELKPLRWIGTLSYSIYLWQQLFIGEVGWRWAVFPWNFAAMFPAAILSSYAIGQPFLRLRKRFSAESRASIEKPPPAIA